MPLPSPHANPKESLAGPRQEGAGGPVVSGGVVKFRAPTSHGAMLEVPGAPVPGALSSRGQGSRDLATPTLTLLVFLPYAFSPVCGDEVRQLQQRRERITGMGTRIVGVTCDSIVTLRAWGIAEGIEFDLVSDFWPHGQISQQVGAFDAEGGRPKRHTLLLDGAGVIRWRWEYPAGTGRPVAEYLAAIEQIGATQVRR